jgi:hypothetical protein
MNKIINLKINNKKFLKKLQKNVKIFYNDIFII